MGEARRLPIDHPDFFDLPPPPGRSRESGIVLDEHGRFSNAGIPIDHDAMAVAFASWIRRHPDDGRYILTNGYDWTYFKVEDVPYFVRGLGGAPGAPTLMLSDQTEEPFDPLQLGVGARDALYCWVKGGAYEARFTQAAQVALGPYVAEGPEEQPVIRLAGRDTIVAARNERPPLRL